jgi:hypothetical protein
LKNALLVLKNATAPYCCTTALLLFYCSSLHQALQVLKNATALKEVEEQLLWRSALLADGPSVAPFFF